MSQVPSCRTMNGPRNETRKEQKMSLSISMMTFAAWMSACVLRRCGMCLERRRERAHHRGGSSRPPDLRASWRGVPVMRSCYTSLLERDARRRRHGGPRLHRASRRGGEGPVCHAARARSRRRDGGLLVAATAKLVFPAGEKDVQVSYPLEFSPSGRSPGSA